MLQVAHTQTPLGDVLLVAGNNALVACCFANEPDYLHFIECGENQPDAAPLSQARMWLERYFAGEKPDPRELPLVPQGTDFQRLVWSLLLDVPYGGTTTYGELANLAALARGGGRMAAQAIGGAVGKNPIPIIIPCHRVLAAHGGLGGYSGGLSKKVWLLDHEGIDADALKLWKTGRFSKLDGFSGK